MSEGRAPTNGVKSGRQSRVVLAPVAGVKPAEVLRNPTGFRRTFNPPAMEAKGIRLQGELGISRKPIAQGMPGCSGCTCMLVCANHQRYLHTRPRVPAGTRHSLRPLDLRAKRQAQLGRNAPREGETVSTSLRAQRSNPWLNTEIDGLLRFARNDVDGAQVRRMGRAQRNPSPTQVNGGIDGYRFAPPILRKRRTRPLADHPRNLTAPFPPPRDPNGLRNVQLSTLFSALCCQNWLQPLRTSDAGTINR
jgi:hypothetical protein